MAKRNFLNWLSNLSPPFHLSYWRWLRRLILSTADAVALSCAYWASFFMRLESFDFGSFEAVFYKTLPIFVAVNLVVFGIGRLNSQLWRFANFSTAVQIGKLLLIGTIGSAFIVSTIDHSLTIPRSVPFLFWMIAYFFVISEKFSWRVVSNFQQRLRSRNQSRCFIYGAGNAGELLSRQIKANPNFPYKAVGFIDDDKNKRGRVINSIKVQGTGDKLQELAEKHRVGIVLIAINSASGAVIRTIFDKCNDAELRPLIVPDVANIMDENVFRPRPVSISDLLKRSPKGIDHEGVKSLFNNRDVLVSGGGGSIGSEICRQVLRCSPKKVIILDNSEFNLYQVHKDLLGLLGDQDVEIVAVLGSAADERVVERVFRDHRPDYVLHAAAYKHVPIVESNKTEGILNNVISTQLLAQYSIIHKVKRFLLISSDKAVNPTNVMGSTKRCCELLIQTLSQMDPNIITKFCAVRFGNVLGSSGSVIPLFKNQIKKGGPVTVTHPDMTRYFMLTSEAVALVLQSIHLSKGGEVFVLNMGDPVNIYEMAKELIRLSGHVPDEDIKIEFVGLRPGEKLYEELILQNTESSTQHEDIFIATSKLRAPQEIHKKINEMIALAKTNETDRAIEILRKLADWRPGGAGKPVNKKHAPPPPLH